MSCSFCRGLHPVGGTIATFLRDRFDAAILMGALHRTRLAGADSSAHALHVLTERMVSEVPRPTLHDALRDPSGESLFTLSLPYIAAAAEAATAAPTPPVVSSRASSRGAKAARASSRGAPATPSADAAASDYSGLSAPAPAAASVGAVSSTSSGSQPAPVSRGRSLGTRAAADGGSSHAAVGGAGAMPPPPSIGGTGTAVEWPRAARAASVPRAGPGPAPRGLVHVAWDIENCHLGLLHTETSKPGGEVSAAVCAVQLDISVLQYLRLAPHLALRFDGPRLLLPTSSHTAPLPHRISSHQTPSVAA